MFATGFYILCPIDYKTLYAMLSGSTISQSTLKGSVSAISIAFFQFLKLHLGFI